MAEKIFMTNGGSLKAMDNIADSWDFVEAMKQTADAELYARVSAVYRAANLTADALSNMPFAVMKGSADYDTSADWQNKIGTMPSPRQLLRLLRMSLFMTNTGYARLAKTNSVKKRWFYVVPSSMTIETDPVTGEVKELRRWLGGSWQSFKPDDPNLLTMWKLDFTTELLPSPNTEFKALAESAGVLHYADVWTKNYFKNGAVKPTVLAVKGLMLADKQVDMQTAWAKFVRGIGKTWSELAKVINAETMDVKTFGDGLGDIKESPVYQQAIENVAMASGMPLSLLLSNSANYATAQAEYASWFRDSVTPAAYLMQEALNEQIFAPLGLRFEFRPESAEPSQQEEVERASAYSTYISAGMKPSIAAQVVGLDLPADVEYTDLDPEEEAEPVEETQQDTHETPQEAPQAAETPAPDVEEEEDDEEPAKGLTFSAWQELDIWKRKAAKAAKRGEALPVEFVCNHIPDNYADTIRTLLQRGDVGAAFEVKHEGGGHDQQTHGNGGGGESYKENVSSRDTMYRLPSSNKSADLLTLAAALNRAADAAMQPAVKAEPPMQPVINVTMPAITLNAHMPQQDAPQVTVNIPEQPAPVVTVTNEVQPAAVEVKNAPANVTVNIPPREPLTAELTTDPRTGRKILKAK